MKKINKRLCALVLIGGIALSTMTGCTTYEATPEEEYARVDSTSGDSDFITSGLTQTIKVPGENFSLIAQFNCDRPKERQWRVTSDKFLYYKMFLEGLPDNTEVFIDNVHVDVSIKSKYAYVDGIIQDSMDDRIHNAQLLGFPISNDKSYIGVFAIEGANQDFLSLTYYGYLNYSGSITERRYTESDYRSLAVTDNKFLFVIDLLVKGPNDKDFRNISICTDFLVPVSQEPIEFKPKTQKTYTKTIG